MNAVSRNAQCPCGSGKKYKRCCGQDTKAPSGSQRGWLTYGLALSVVLAVAAYLYFGTWKSAGITLSIGVMIVFGVDTFRDPPPPKGGKNSADAINFGN